MIAVVCDDCLCGLRRKPVGNSVTQFFLGAQDNDIALLVVGASTSFFCQRIGCAHARDREGQPDALTIQGARLGSATSVQTPRYAHVAALRDQQR